MSELSKLRHYINCESMYSDKSKGISGIYNYVEENNIGDWEYCEPCEIEQPFLCIYGENVCLVCGSVKTPN